MTDDRCEEEVNRLTRLLVLAPIVLLLPGLAFGLVLEAEDFVAYHDEGGVSIYVVSCSGASGGLAVEGFDTVGDWIELDLEIAEAGSFVDTLRSAGLLVEESDLMITYLGAGPEGSDLTSTFHTFGQGIG